MSLVGPLEGFLFLPLWRNSWDALRPFFAADGMAAVATPVGVIDSLGEPAGRGVGDLLLRAQRGLGGLRGVGDLLGDFGRPLDGETATLGGLTGMHGGNVPVLGPLKCARDGLR